MACKTLFIWLVLTLIKLRFSVINGEKQPSVSTTFGEVNGYYMKTREGRQIAAFTSIPFALPPVGDLRFKAPVPVKKWEEPLDATHLSPWCVQRNPYIRQEDIVGQEDCLYLNIYTPYTGNVCIPLLWRSSGPTNLNDTYYDRHAKKNEILLEEDLLAVMVFIHGGGWMCGAASTDMYGPEYLLDQNVILVTINYRLGPLGFLSTQDEHCPGNNGLKDQQEALRFIKKTIHKFGGDKNSVTIFGESAGGASVHYHMLSQTSSGLFHKAISESGTAMVPWAEASPGEALRNAFYLAKLLNCPQAPSERMLTCLRSKDSYDIINTEFSFYAWDYEPMTPFKAVVEPELPGAFLTRGVRQTPAVSAVPWMTGLTRDEGCLKSGWITFNSTRFQEFMAGFDTIAPVTFYYENSPYVDGITKKIRQKYFKSQDYNDLKSGIVDIYTDSYFAYPVIEAVAHTFNYTDSPIYLYELSYKAANSFSQIFGIPDGEDYICHADDLMYLFPIHFLSKKPTFKDIEMSKLIITLFTNFAKSGNPNKPGKIPFDWIPASSGKNMEYIKIGEDSVMKKDLAYRSRFWGTLPLWHNVRTRQFIDEL